MPFLPDPHPEWAASLRAMQEGAGALAGEFERDSIALLPDDPRLVRKRARIDTLWGDIHAMEERLIATPARSPAGVIAKLRCLMHDLGMRDGTPDTERTDEERLLRSIIADLEGFLPVSGTGRPDAPILRPDDGPRHMPL